MMSECWIVLQSEKSILLSLSALLLFSPGSAPSVAVLTVVWRYEFLSCLVCFFFFALSYLKSDRSVAAQSHALLLLCPCTISRPAQLMCQPERWWYSHGDWSPPCGLQYGSADLISRKPLWRKHLEENTLFFDREISRTESFIPQRELFCGSEENKINHFSQASHKRTPLRRHVIGYKKHQKLLSARACFWHAELSKRKEGSF